MIHPNVLPLLGITTNPLQLVSDWMSGGDLPRYIKCYPDADRLRLVSIPYDACIPRLLQFQIYEVAKGLSYLHSCNDVHGDLKGVRPPSKYPSQPYLHLTSKTSFWMTLVECASRISARPRLFEAWIP